MNLAVASTTVTVTKTFPHTISYIDRAERLNCRKSAFGSASESEEMHHKTYLSGKKRSASSATQRSTAIPIMFTIKAGVEALSGVHGCVRCCRECNKESEDRETHDCWNGGDCTMLFRHFVYLALLIYLYSVRMAGTRPRLGLHNPVGDDTQPCLSCVQRCDSRQLIYFIIRAPHPRTRSDGSWRHMQDAWNSVDQRKSKKGEIEISGVPVADVSVGIRGIEEDGRRGKG